ncbi:peptidylprolyl isomerase [Sphingobacteriaceae bacterium]|nr:peptidylprolyl isomerase [Sphingobacteriaceae bacterium]
MIRYLQLFCLLIFAVACKKDKVSQATKDEKIITEYIANKGLSAVATGSGLYYVIIKEGTGPQPTSSSKVKIDYIGYLTDGTVFDLSPSGGITSDLTKVIEGWREGIPYFKKGTKGMLLIPSALGYGKQSQGSIPANSVLVFDIVLTDIIN